MSKKTILIPTALLALCTLAGCGGKGGSSAANKLDEFVKGLKEGEVSKADLEGIYADGVFNASDASVKYATYEMLDYTPYWSIGSGQEESYYEENVHKLSSKESFRSYDNNIVVVTQDYSNLPYDKSAVVDEDSEGLASVATTYKGQGIIHASDDEVRYTYTRDSSASNAYSFSHARDNAKGVLENYTQGGGLSENIAAGIKDVEETYAYYDGQVTWGTHVENFAASKDEKGVLTVNYTGDLNYDLYSAERYWGWDDAENPTIKETSDYDGMYVQMGIRFAYSYTVNNGFITAANATYFGYYRTLMKDKNWKSGDAVPDYELTDDYIATLDLYVPDTITINGKTTANPYTGKGVMSNLPYTLENFTTSGASLKSYDDADIPDESAYRDSDATDVGCWFDVREMDELGE